MSNWCVECFSDSVSDAGTIRTCHACGAVAERSGEIGWRITSHGRPRAALAGTSSSPAPSRAAAPAACEFCLVCQASYGLEDLTDGGQVCRVCGSVMARRPNGNRLVTSAPAPRVDVAVSTEGPRPFIGFQLAVHNPAHAAAGVVAHVVAAFKAALAGFPPGHRAILAESFERASGGHLIIGRGLALDGRSALALAHLGGTRIQVDADKTASFDLVTLSAILAHELEHARGNGDETFCDFRGEEAASARAGRRN